MKISPTEAMVISILMEAAIKAILKEVEGMSEEEKLAKIKEQEAHLDNLMERIASH